MNTEDPPADASTLIYLAKADDFRTAAQCVERLVVPDAVWREAVDSGERIGAAEVPRIRDAAEGGFLERVTLGALQQRDADGIAATFRLGQGESEVLCLARAGGAAIVDEGRAARVAQSLGIVPLSTLFLPLVGAHGGRLPRGEAVAFLRRLAIVTGARAEVVFEIERRIEEER